MSSQPRILPAANARTVSKIFPRGLIGCSIAGYRTIKLIRSSLLRHRVQTASRNETMQRSRSMSGSLLVGRFNNIEDLLLLEWIPNLHFHMVTPFYLRVTVDTPRGTQYPGPAETRIPKTSSVGFYLFPYIEGGSGGLGLSAQMIFRV